MILNDAFDGGLDSIRRYEEDYKFIKTFFI